MSRKLGKHVLQSPPLFWNPAAHWEQSPGAAQLATVNVWREFAATWTLVFTATLLHKMVTVGALSPLPRVVMVKVLGPFGASILSTDCTGSPGTSAAPGPQEAMTLPPPSVKVQVVASKYPPCE